MENVQWDEMGQHANCISHGTLGALVKKLMVEKLPKLTDFLLSETVDKQEIENLLN